MDLTPDPADKIGYEVHERWRAMPNRDAYVATMMATAARDGYRAGREDAARAVIAEADDEAKRPGRNCCSHKIEEWLRVAAEVARSGSYLRGPITTYAGVMRPEDVSAAPNGARVYLVDVDQHLVRVDGEWVPDQGNQPRTPEQGVSVDDQEPQR